MSPDLIEAVKRAEGFSAVPYRCPQGFLTIGWGTNIESISPAEAEWLLIHRLKKTAEEVRSWWPWISRLSQPRQEAIFDMAYNLGTPKLAGFKKMLAALERGDFDTAADEAMDSRWAKQVGHRAQRIARIIRTGEQ